MTPARDDAALVLARDPQLKSERGQALRVLRIPEGSVHWQGFIAFWPS
jgi:hypothetical protein